MNIANPIGFADALDLDDLKNRLELFRLNVIDQLRKEPTIYHANPSLQPELVAGAKTGDVAVWKDESGVDHFALFA